MVSNPNFYLVVGILIYLGATFFFNILANNVSKEQSDRYWHFTYIPEIIKNILFMLAVLIHSRFPSGNQPKKSESVPYLDMI